VILRLVQSTIDLPGSYVIQLGWIIHERT
jgi:hypothetical protein